jgi:hypothetical protein
MAEVLYQKEIDYLLESMYKAASEGLETEFEEDGMSLEKFKAMIFVIKKVFSFA